MEPWKGRPLVSGLNGQSGGWGKTPWHRNGFLADAAEVRK